MKFPPPSGQSSLTDTNKILITLFASFEFLTAAYPGFPFFSSMHTKHHSPSKQWCPITHWRTIHQKNEILTLSRFLTVLELRYSLLLPFLTVLALRYSLLLPFLTVLTLRYSLLLPFLLYSHYVFSPPSFSYCTCIMLLSSLCFLKLIFLPLSR